MYYEKDNEKVPVVPMQISQSTTNLDYRKNSDIRKTRTIVLVLLGIQLVFAIAYFINECVKLSEYHDLSYAQREKEGVASYVGGIVGAGVSVTYLIVFIFLVVKYVRIGILVFAWLGLIHLIIILIIIILAIIAIIGVTATLHHAGIGVGISVAIIVLAGIASLFGILTVVFSFKLAKLIRMQEAYQFV